MAPLRDSEFLSAIKHRSAIPGGTCDFDLPDYSYWLNRPAPVRSAEFGSWLALIRPLCDSIAELLWLTRQNAKRKSETAAGGIFQLQFDRENPCQLVRVTLPAAERSVPGNQRQPASLHHPIPALDRRHQSAGACGNRRAFPADLLHLSRRRDGEPGEMPNLPAAGGMVGAVAVPPVLQRSLPADRPGRLAHRAAQDSRRARRRARAAGRTNRPDGTQ